MAAGIIHSCNVPEIFMEIYALNQHANDEHQMEFYAVRKIQSWFRGFQTRKALRQLNMSALTIQRCWRGMKGRKEYRKKLRIRADAILSAYYYQQAVIVQRHWRGFLSRKFKFNYYKTKQHLNFVACQNEKVIDTMDQYSTYMKNYYDELEQKEQETKLNTWARKCHYLVSTSQRSGVYRSPLHKQNSLAVERLLQSAKPLSHERPQTEPEFSDQTCRSYELPRYYTYYEKKDALPPLSKKPQGPFRQPVEVRNQRFKPLNPTLRVQHDYFSDEAAQKELESMNMTKNVHDDRFKYFYPQVAKERKLYIPELQTKSQYIGDIKADRTGRTFDPSRNMGCTDFKLVQPPVPLFDKFNDTYSKGQEV